jgi:hypothetical protein
MSEQLLMRFPLDEKVVIEPKHTFVDDPEMPANVAIAASSALEIAEAPDLATLEGDPNGRSADSIFRTDRPGSLFHQAWISVKPYRRRVAYSLRRRAKVRLAPVLPRVGEEALPFVNDLVGEALQLLARLPTTGLVATDLLESRAKLVCAHSVLRRFRSSRRRCKGRTDQRPAFRKSKQILRLLAGAIYKLCTGNVVDCTMRVQVARTLLP